MSPEDEENCIHLLALAAMYEEDGNKFWEKVLRDSVALIFRLERQLSAKLPQTPDDT